MKIELSNKWRFPIFVLLFLLTILSLANTNSNPASFIERVFKPIHIGEGSVIYYAGIIPLIIIYYFIKEIYYKKQYSFLDTKFKRIVVLMLMVSIIPHFTENGIKMLKMFSEDLNSIYCYRDSMDLSLKSDELDKMQVICTLEFENCSNRTQKFNVKLKTPMAFMKEISEDILDKRNVELPDMPIKLHRKERRLIEIVFSVDRAKTAGDWYGNTKNFEFSIYNNNQEVKYIQRDEMK